MPKISLVSSSPVSHLTRSFSSSSPSSSFSSSFFSRHRLMLTSAAVLSLSILVPSMLSSTNIPTLPITHPPPSSLPPYASIVFGSTGAVGNELVQELLQSPQCVKVTAVIRNQRVKEEFKRREDGTIDIPTPSNSTIIASIFPSFSSLSPEDIQKLQILPVEDFSYLSTYRPLLSTHSTAFSSLGSTLKRSGSQENFIQNDYQTNAIIVDQLADAGVNVYSLVSSGGANPASSFFYLRTKGQLEQKVIDAKFPTTLIFRPGLILTKKEREEKRTGESVARWAFEHLQWAFNGMGAVGNMIRGASVTQIARAMVQRVEEIHVERKEKPVQVKEGETARVVELYENKEIVEMKFDPKTHAKEVEELKSSKRERPSKSWL